MLCSINKQSTSIMQYVFRSFWFVFFSFFSLMHQPYTKVYSTAYAVFNSKPKATGEKNGENSSSIKVFIYVCSIEWFWDTVIIKLNWYARWFFSVFFFRFLFQVLSSIVSDLFDLVLTFIFWYVKNIEFI